MAMYQTSVLKWILLIVLSCSNFTYAMLPRIVADEIRKKQSLEFERVLSELSPSQRQLIIDRYADLLLRSPLAVGMPIKKEELTQFLLSEFLHPLQGQQIENKKKKSRNAFTQATEQKVEILVKTFHGSVRGKVMDLNFACGKSSFELPLEIVDEKDSFSLRLNGVSVPQSIDHNENNSSLCLEVTFYRKSDFAILSWVGTQTVACPISPARAGECLLDVSEQIATALGSKGIDLVDVASIKCSKNRETADLTRLKIYQEGKGWYEKKGYLPSRDVISYRQKIDTSLSYPLSLLTTKLEDAQIKDNTKGAKNIFLKKAREFMSLDKGTTLANFMGWLWDEDCVSYIEIDRFLKSRRGEIDFPNIYDLPSHLMKRLN